MIYTHVWSCGGRRVRGPLDGLRKAACSEGAGMIRTGRSTRSLFYADQDRFYPGRPKHKLGEWMPAGQGDSE
jgi:hypothetical protein